MRVPAVLVVLEVVLWEVLLLPGLPWVEVSGGGGHSESSPSSDGESGPHGESPSSPGGVISSGGVSAGGVTSSGGGLSGGTTSGGVI